MAGEKDGALSAREMEVLALAWQCMESQPKIDMAKLASLTGVPPVTAPTLTRLKYTPGSASVTMGNIKRKLKLLGDTMVSNGGPTTPRKAGGPGRGKTTTPKSTAGAKRGAIACETPSKRQKKGERQKQLLVEDDEDDGEEMCETKGIRVKKEEYAGEEEGETAFAMLEGLTSFAGQGDEGENL
ncbi:hypothetical protein NX059_005661 [Plenodomus lindquistii]|nr:hypothetical protein NX059_005661 [Plenodomus lindquistii]